MDSLHHNTLTKYDQIVSVNHWSYVTPGVDILIIILCTREVVTAEFILCCTDLWLTFFFILSVCSFFYIFDSHLHPHSSCYIHLSPFYQNVPSWSDSTVVLLFTQIISGGLLSHSWEWMYWAVWIIHSDSCMDKTCL